MTLRSVCTDSRLAESWGMNGLRFCNLPPLEKNAAKAKAKLKADKFEPSGHPAGSLMSGPRRLAGWPVP